MRPVRAPTLLALLLLAGCATATTPGASATPTPSTGGAGSASPTKITVSTRPDPGPSSPRGTCGLTTLTVAQASTPPPGCLHVGTDLHITSEPSPLQPWSAVDSSDPSVLRCASDRHPAGDVSATCHAAKPGIVTMSATTAPFAGDPHGPAQYRWQITITVVA